METIRKTLQPATIYTIKCASASTADVTFAVLASDGTIAETWTLTPGQTKIWRCSHPDVDISSAGNPSYSIIPFTSGSEPIVVSGGTGGTGGGITEERVAAIAGELADAAIDEALHMEAETTAATPAGAEDIVYHWCQLVAGHAPAGNLKSVVVQCRMTDNPAMTTEPRYLCIWEADAAGNWQRLGASENAVAQSPGTASRWQFAGIRLAGRALRLALLVARADPWPGKTSVFGARSTAALDGSIVSYTAGQSAYLPEVSITCSETVMRFAPEEHVRDAVAHVTAEERAAWSAKADTGAPINATQLIDPSNDNPVFVTSSEGLGLLAPPASGAVCLSLTEGRHLGRPFVLITTPSGEICIEPHQLRMLYGSKVFRLGGENGSLTCGLSQYGAQTEYVTATLEAVIQAPTNTANHTEDVVMHVTAEERAAWNAKAEASALSEKVNVATYRAHTADKIVHVTAEERAKWDAASQCITAESGDGSENPNGDGHAWSVENLKLNATMWGHSPEITLEWEGNHKATYGADRLKYQEAGQAEASVALPELIAHPANVDLHISAEERAGLAALLAHKDALLALLTPTQNI